MPDTNKKRIVICADGTWNDPEDENPTNVLRVARAVKPIASDATRQVVFYDWGVGSYHSKVRGGAFGVGIMKNIQDGYRFIVQNYHPGDEVVLFGFSRGAYTVRCLAGLLNNCGILKRSKADRIPEAFRLYKKRNTPPSSPAAGDWRKSHTYGEGRGVVDFIGVWDTVGALGMPTRVLAFMDEKDLFYDHELGSNVRVARHAVSLDERRGDFEPTLWTKKEAVDIKQVWFAGVHADVGGGYAATADGRSLSDIPLAWMAAEAGRFGLEFESHLVRKTKLDPGAPRHRSHRGFYRVLKKRERRIPLESVMHESVKKRHETTGYRSKSLSAWLQARKGKWGTLEVTR
jgi:uncharacterized protein (DUF2235 family)